MGQRSGDQRVADLFTKESHHRNLSVIHTAQNTFYKGKETIPSSAWISTISSSSNRMGTSNKFQSWQGTLTSDMFKLVLFMEKGGLYSNHGYPSAHWPDLACILCQLILQNYLKTRKSLPDLQLSNKFPYPSKKPDYITRLLIWYSVEDCQKEAWTKLDWSWLGKQIVFVKQYIQSKQYTFHNRHNHFKHTW